MNEENSNIDKEEKAGNESMDFDIKELISARACFDAWALMKCMRELKAISESIQKIANIKKDNDEDAQ